MLSEASAAHPHVEKDDINDAGSTFVEILQAENTDLKRW